MENTRFLKITIVVLLIINIATLTFMWLSHRHMHNGGPAMHGHGGHGPHGGPAGAHGNAFEFLVRELNLTDEQKQKLEKMRDEHHEQAAKMHRQNGPMHHRFFDMLANADTAAVLRLADSMGQFHKNMELMTFAHFKKIRAICTPAQQKKFDEVINEALRMMAPGPYDHAAGPPRHP